MSLTETLFVLAIILVLIDIFFVSDIPTHLAYILITIAIVKNINDYFLYQVLYGILILFSLVLFHYFIWRNVLEKINDQFISPRKHLDGYQGLIGKTGIIQDFDGKLVIVVGEEIFQFHSDIPVNAGEIHTIKNINSSTVVI
jgi:membrane protein implicated in regulation of membrane protease activity